MLNKEKIKKQFEGKTEEESLRILAEQYNISWTLQPTSCKFWFTKVFTYCSDSQLEYQLNLFLWFINFIVVPITNSCFNEEATVLLGCTCPCGHKQTILYFTLSPNA
jgi:hypothetical protein